MTKSWIQGMHMKEGALHEMLDVPEGAPIPAKMMAKAASGKMGPLAEKRAQLAKTLKKLGKK